MTSSHALTLAAVPTTSFWSSTYWLPRDWATWSFVILSGFTAASVLPWLQDPRRTRAIVHRRAAQLIAIMCASNALFQAARAALSSVWSEMATATWWVDVFSSGSSYSLSGVLLPTSVLLIVSPLLFWGYTKLGWRGLVILVVAATLASWWTLRQIDARGITDAHTLRFFFRTGLGGFPVLPLAALGALGFCLGLRRELLTDRWLGIRVVAVIALLATIDALPATHARPIFVRDVIVCMLHFLVTLHLALLLIRPGHGAIASAIGARSLGLIGQYSLFSFLAHRAIMQVMAATLPAASQPSTLLYFEYFAGTMLLVWMLCWWRAQAPTVSSRLKALGL